MFFEKDSAAPVNPTSAMQKAATPALLSALKEVLADAEVLSVKAHGYHWNVVGADFSQYHDLFGEIYDDVYESVDPIAENLRKLGEQAPASLREFLQMTSISDNNIGISAPSMMAEDLAAANRVMLRTLQRAFDAASAANEQGIADFIAGRIDMQQKWDWQLTASMQKAAPMKTENGIQFPAAAFAYVPDTSSPSTWKLRLWEDNGVKETRRQIGMAVAALGEGFRGQRVQIPAADRAAVIARVRNAWKKVNEESAELPAVLAD